MLFEGGDALSHVASNGCIAGGRPAGPIGVAGPIVASHHCSAAGLGVSGLSPPVFVPLPPLVSAGV